MAQKVTLVTQYGNPTFSSLIVNGFTNLSGSFFNSGSITTANNLIVSGNALFNNISISGSGSFELAKVKLIGGSSYNENIRCTAQSNDYSSLILGAVTGDSGTGVGQWALARNPSASNYKFTIRYNATDNLTIDTSGNLTITGQYTGSGAGLTGTAASLSIGGNAGSVTYLPGRTDSAAYPILWGAAYTNTIGTIAYSCAAVTIQSSTGTINATAISLSGTITSTGNQFINNSSPTIYLQDTDNRSSMVHCNSNIFYVLRGSGTNSTSWAQYNGYWPLEINLENNNAQFGGNITAIYDVTAYSDARVKKNITTIKKALDKVLQLRGVSYQRTDMDSDKTHIGVIAQEIQQVLPEVVSEDDKGHLSVAYGNIIGVLIEAIKEQHTQIETLKAKIG
jgi:hypothetical protein